MHETKISACFLLAWYLVRTGDEASFLQNFAPHNKRVNGQYEHYPHVQFATFESLGTDYESHRSQEVYDCIQSW